MALEEVSSPESHNIDTSPDSSCTCGICNKRYTDPRVLPCLHSFCLACIQSLMAEEDGSTHECPTCKQVLGDNPELLHRNIYLSDRVLVLNKFDAITSSPPPFCSLCETTEENYNVSVAYCFDELLCGFMCEGCYDIHKRQGKRNQSHTVLKLDEARNENQEVILEKIKKKTDSMSKCIIHENMEFTHHCKKCFKPVCMTCLENHHLEHDYCNIKEVNVSDFKEDIHCRLTTLGQESGKVRSSIGQFEEMKEKVKQRGEEITMEVNEVFKGAHEQLSHQHEQLHARTKAIVQKKVANLEEKQKALESAADASDICESLVKEACEEYNKVQFLSMKKPISDRATFLEEELKTVPNDLCETADITLCLDTEKMQQAIKDFGSIEDITPCAKECTAIIPSHVLARDTKMLVRLITRDQQKNLVRNGGSIVKGCLQQGKKINHCEVEDCRNGVYKVWVKASDTGKYEFVLTVNGQKLNLARSTIRILPIHDYKTFNVSLQTITGLKKPQSIMFTGDGSMYISSKADKSVHVYDNNGKPKPTLLNLSSLSLLAPCGIDLWDDKILYITDCGSHKIHRYEMGGNCLSSICTEGHNIKQVQNPKDVKVDPSHNLYISDTGNHRVQVLNGNDGHSFSHAITDFG